jgi:3-ketosteroid 9alpha-monooxygenase subunit B
MSKNKEMMREENVIESSITGKKLRHIRGVVIKAERETSDTWTLHIFVNNNDKDYVAGQFVSISPHQFPELLDLVKFLEYEKGKKEPIRAYSLASAPHEKYVSITIKPEAYEPYPGSLPPLLSPILASDVLVGREIEFIGYTGAYTMPHNLSPTIDHVVHLVAGSGIVPSFSIIKDELINQKNTHTKHIVIDVNKSFNDIIFHDELVNLKKKFPDRFSCIHFLSQENSNGIHGENYIYGRPSIEHIERLVKYPTNCLFFACGPAITKWQKKHAQESGAPLKPRFMEWVHEVIEKLRVDKKHFKREIYG